MLAGQMDRHARPGVTRDWSGSNSVVSQSLIARPRRVGSPLGLVRRGWYVEDGLFGGRYALAVLYAAGPRRSQTRLSDGTYSMRKPTERKHYAHNPWAV